MEQRLIKFNYNQCSSQHMNFMKKSLIHKNYL